MLAPYNKLPVRNEYILKVTNSIKLKGRSFTSIQNRTGLTRTQVACTLDQMINEGLVDIELVKGKKVYKYR